MAGLSRAPAALPTVTISSSEDEGDTSVHGQDDATINHLGSDLPDPASQSQAGGTTGDQTHTGSDVADGNLELASLPLSPEREVAMGANNSHEEIQSAIRATSAELLSRNSKTAVESASLLNASRKGASGNGKLKRVSQRVSSPRTRRTAHASAMPSSSQRRMMAPPRPDPYDILASPERERPTGSKTLSQAKIRQLRQQGAAGSKAFSPMRRQKRQRQVSDATVGPSISEAPHAKDQKDADEQLRNESRMRAQTSAAADETEERVHISPRRSSRRNKDAVNEDLVQLPYGKPGKNKKQSGRQTGEQDEAAGEDAEEDVEGYGETRVADITTDDRPDPDADPYKAARALVEKALLEVAEHGAEMDSQAVMYKDFFRTDGRAKEERADGRPEQVEDMGDEELDEAGMAKSDNGGALVAAAEAEEEAGIDAEEPLQEIEQVPQAVRNKKERAEHGKASSGQPAKEVTPSGTIENSSTGTMRAPKRWSPRKTATAGPHGDSTSDFPAAPEQERSLLSVFIENAPNEGAAEDLSIRPKRRKGRPKKGEPVQEPEKSTPKRHRAMADPALPRHAAHRLSRGPDGDWGFDHSPPLIRSRTKPIESPRAATDVITTQDSSRFQNVLEKKNAAAPAEDDAEPGAEEEPEDEQEYEEPAHNKDGEGYSERLFSNGDQDEAIVAAPAPAPEADFVQPGEMFLDTGSGSGTDQSSANDEEDRDEVSDEPVRRHQRTRGAKRAAPQAETANTSKRRKKFGAVDEESASEPDDEDDTSEVHRMYGTWPTLVRIFNARSKIGVTKRKNGDVVHHRLSLEDKQVKELVSACKLAISAHHSLATGSPEERDDLDELADEQLYEIQQKVAAFYTENAEWVLNLEDETMVTDTHAFAFPALVKLLKHVILCYEIMDGGQESGEISRDHIGCVIGLIDVIFKLKAGMNKYSAKPATILNVNAPVRNHIVNPLRDEVRQALYAQWKERGPLVKSAAAAAAASERDEATQLRNAEAEAIKEAAHQRRAKWLMLHARRRDAETGWPAILKIEHLMVPDSVPDTDANRSSFKRLAVFTPRAGPTPGKIEQAKETAAGWSAGQKGALWDGLREYHGPNAYERIFAAHCKMRGLLNPYNVTEIVTQAAELRQLAIDKWGSQTEQWMLDIPVWIKERDLSGQENRERAGTVDVDADA